METVMITLILVIILILLVIFSLYTTKIDNSLK